MITDSSHYGVFFLERYIMKFNLITQKINNQQINTVSARELHSILESKRHFNDWIKYRIEQYDFVAEEDYISITQKNVLGQNNNLEITQIEYYVTVDVAKELAMVENNEQGKKVRKYFIELEKQQKPKTPQTYLEALEELVAITKEKERLQSLNNALCHVTKTYIASELAKEIGLKSAKELNKNYMKKAFNLNKMILGYLTLNILI